MEAPTGAGEQHISPMCPVGPIRLSPTTSFEASRLLPARRFPPLLDFGF